MPDTVHIRDHRTNARYERLSALLTGIGAELRFNLRSAAPASQSDATGLGCGERCACALTIRPASSSATAAICVWGGEPRRNDPDVRAGVKPLRFVAEQIGADPEALIAYAARFQTRYEQVEALRKAFGFARL